MFQLTNHKRSNIFYKAISMVMVCVLTFPLMLPSANLYAGPSSVTAVGFPNLPVPGSMVNPSPAYAPVLLKAVKVYPAKPFHFDFIVDRGDSGLEDEALKAESEKLVRYFLASLAVPEEDLWVNLSPHESDRIIPRELGLTEMGRDLLAQDYLLKQLTASLMYPEDEIGQKFWQRIRKKAYERYGTTEIPMNTFHKVWIVPEKASVYQTEDTAYVVEGRLKVMLEQDYVALEQSRKDSKLDVGRWELNVHASDNQKALNVQHPTFNFQKGMTNELESEIIREILLPEIEKEVNQGQNFAQLRQIYHTLILATWYKMSLKESLLGQAYVDRKNVQGIDLADRDTKTKIYDQYLEAYQKGVYNYIREEYEQSRQSIIPRKYFSGGAGLQTIGTAKVWSAMDARAVQLPLEQLEALDLTRISVAFEQTSEVLGNELSFESPGGEDTLFGSETWTPLPASFESPFNLEDAGQRSLWDDTFSLEVVGDLLEPQESPVDDVAMLVGLVKSYFQANAIVDGPESQLLAGAAKSLIDSTDPHEISAKLGTKRDLFRTLIADQGSESLGPFLKIYALLRGVQQKRVSLPGDLNDVVGFVEGVRNSAISAADPIFGIYNKNFTLATLIRYGDVFERISYNGWMPPNVQKIKNYFENGGRTHPLAYSFLEAIDALLSWDSEVDRRLIRLNTKIPVNGEEDNSRLRQAYDYLLRAKDIERQRRDRFLEALGLAFQSSQGEPIQDPILFLLENGRRLGGFGEALITLVQGHRIKDRVPSDTQTRERYVQTLDQIADKLLNEHTTRATVLAATMIEVFSGKARSLPGEAIQERMSELYDLISNEEPRRRAYLFLLYQYVLLPWWGEYRSQGGTTAFTGAPKGISDFNPDFVAKKREEYHDSVSPLQEGDPEFLPQDGGVLILGRLGAGGMGEVYLAWHMRRRTEIAVKISNRYPKQLAREKAEMLDLSRDPTVARVMPNIYGRSGLLENTQSILMQWIRGRSLQRYIAENTLTFSERLHLFAELVAAVSAMHNHRKRVLHQDLKPANIQVTTDGRVYVLDYGLAQSKKRSLRKKGRTVMGTAAYMAPELLQGDNTTVQSDIYALGLIGAELFTGRHPYAVKSDPMGTVRTLQQLERIEVSLGESAFGDMPLLTGEIRALRGSLESVLNGMLARSRSERYAETQPILEALGRIMAPVQEDFPHFRIAEGSGGIHPTVAAHLIPKLPREIFLLFWQQAQRELQEESLRGFDQRAIEEEFLLYPIRYLERLSYENLSDILRVLQDQTSGNPLQRPALIFMEGLLARARVPDTLDRSRTASLLNAIPQEISHIFGRLSRGHLLFQGVPYASPEQINAYVQSNLMDLLIELSQRELIFLINHLTQHLGAEVRRDWRYRLISRLYIASFVPEEMDLDLASYIWNALPARLESPVKQHLSEAVVNKMRRDSEVDLTEERVNFHMRLSLLRYLEDIEQLSSNYSISDLFQLRATLLSETDVDNALWLQSVRAVSRAINTIAMRNNSVSFSQKILELRPALWDAVEKTAIIMAAAIHRSDWDSGLRSLVALYNRYPELSQRPYKTSVWGAYLTLNAIRQTFLRLYQVSHSLNAGIDDALAEIQGALSAEHKVPRGGKMVALEGRELYEARLLVGLPLLTSLELEKDLSVLEGRQRSQHLERLSVLHGSMGRVLSEATSFSSRRAGGRDVTRTLTNIEHFLNQRNLFNLIRAESQLTVLYENIDKLSFSDMRTFYNLWGRFRDDLETLLNDWEAMLTGERPRNGDTTLRPFQSFTPENIRRVWRALEAAGRARSHVRYNRYYDFFRQLAEIVGPEQNAGGSDVRASSADTAMINAAASVNDLVQGGMNFQQIERNLQIQGERTNVVDPTVASETLSQPLPGLRAVIYQMSPVTIANLRLFLGLAEDKEKTSSEPLTAEWSSDSLIARKEEPISKE